MTFPATGCTLAMSRSGMLDSVIESFDMVAGRNVELNDPSDLIAVVSLKKMPRWMKGCWDMTLRCAVKA